MHHHHPPRRDTLLRAHLALRRRALARKAALPVREGVGELETWTSAKPALRHDACRPIGTIVATRAGPQGAYTGRMRARHCARLADLVAERRAIERLIALQH